MWQPREETVNKSLVRDSWCIYILFVCTAMWQPREETVNKSLVRNSWFIYILFPRRNVNIRDRWLFLHCIRCLYLVEQPQWWSAGGAPHTSCARGTVCSYMLCAQGMLSVSGLLWGVSVVWPTDCLFASSNTSPVYTLSRLQTRPTHHFAHITHSSTKEACLDPCSLPR